MCEDENNIRSGETDMDLYAPVDSLVVDLSLIPSEWYLHRMSDTISPIRLCGDAHNHLKWIVELQYMTGGRLTTGQGKSPQAALICAINNITRTLDMCR